MRQTILQTEDGDETFIPLNVPKKVKILSRPRVWYLTYNIQIRTLTDLIIYVLREIIQNIVKNIEE